MGNSERGIHAGHQARLRKRFFEEGINAFEGHYVIELLLFFAIRTLLLRKRSSRHFNLLKARWSV